MSVNLETSFQRMKQHCDRETGARTLLLAQRAGMEEELEDIGKIILRREQAVILLTKTAEIARGALVSYIEDTVTPPLQAIWGDSRYFKIRQYIHNSKTQETGADFEVYKPVGKAADSLIGKDAGAFVPVHPYSASGGGLADVVSAVLQMTLLEISKPKPGGPLCLDEPTKQLDNVKEDGSEGDEAMLAKKQDTFAEFIGAYAKSSGRQVILSSHNATLIKKASRIVRLQPVDAITCRVVEE